MSDGLAINLDAPCWLWVKAKSAGGYGVLKRNHKTLLAHRYMWEMMRGPIPAGLTVDHLCRVRHCVNPQHMELVTLAENKARGFSVAAIAARRNHCIHGHPYTETNTRVDPQGFRRCRECNRTQKMVRYHKAHPEALHGKGHWVHK